MKIRYYIMGTVAGAIIGYVAYLHVPSIAGQDLFVLLVGAIGSAGLGTVIYMAYKEHLSAEDE